jgi:hypothetical protein
MESATLAHAVDTALEPNQTTMQTISLKRCTTFAASSTGSCQPTRDRMAVIVFTG